MHRFSAPASAAFAVALAGCPATFDFDGGEAYLNAETGEPTWAEYPGLSVTPNIDDDNEDGTVDWQERSIEGDDDVATFLIPADTLKAVKSGNELELRIIGRTDSVRVWHLGVILLGEDGGEAWPVPVPARKADAEDLSFAVEAEGQLDWAQLTLVELDGDEVVNEADLFVTASPLMLNHHLQQSEHTWVLDVSDGGAGFNNRHMIETFTEVLGDEFTAIPGGPYGFDVWVQDEIQIGFLNSGESRTDLIIDSIRDRGLDNFPEVGIVGSELSNNGQPLTRINPGVVAETWGTGFPNSLDSFGNLEVSPPTTVDGLEYPFGRAYYGGDSSLHPTEELTDFLASQKIQKPFMPDTTWLCVGHIDEVTSTVPAAGTERGWKFVMAHVPTAYEILDAMDEGIQLPRYAPGQNGPNGGGHSIGSVGEWVNDNALRQHNLEIQEDILDPMEALFREELNLSDDDIVYMPSTFERVPGCGDAALIPGMVNLIVTNRGDRHDVFLADPYTRQDYDLDDPDASQGDDPFIAWIEDNFPEELDFHFVDNWSTYHMALGEVHCGTNMMRTPASNWWQTAGHLLLEEN